jgi:hypothetical protein
MSKTSQKKEKEIKYTCHVLGVVSIFRLFAFNINQNLKSKPNPNPKANPNPNLKPSNNPNPLLMLTLIVF